MDGYSKYSDMELFLKLQEEDTKALDEIYARFSGLLYRHARNMLRDEEKAKDVLQEVFIHLWKNASKITIRNSLAAYLYGSTRNQVLMELRHTNYIVEYLNSLEKEADRFDMITENTILENELAKRIEAELDLLPKKMREVFIMSRMEACSYQEISQKLNIAMPTVKNQISSAIKILRVKLH